MKIGVIGSNGFIGREIYNHLGKDHTVYPIHQGAPGTRRYDVVIDANGSNSKYKAERDPLSDFQASVDPVMKYINTLKYDKYIYISTIDAESPRKSNYGFNRFQAEGFVMKYAKKWMIIRLCSVIGKKAKKGIVYDILNDEKLFVTKDSLIQIIPVWCVARHLKRRALSKDDHNRILKFYSYGTIEVWDICKMFGAHPTVDLDAETQVYDEKGDFGFLSPEHYLKETFNERVVKPMESV